MLSPFLSNLWKMINDPEIDDIICWYNGRDDAFCVKDVKAFESNILLEYFKHNKFQSFIRQLNMYDFSKIREARHPAWRHDFLDRNEKQKLSRIRRKNASDTDAKAHSSVQKSVSHLLNRIDTLTEELNRERELHAQTTGKIDKLQDIVGNMVTFFTQSGAAGVSPAALSSLSEAMRDLSSSPPNVSLSAAQHASSSSFVPKISPKHSGPVYSPEFKFPRGGRTPNASVSPPGEATAVAGEGGGGGSGGGSGRSVSSSPVAPVAGAGGMPTAADAVDGNGRRLGGNGNGHAMVQPPSSSDGLSRLLESQIEHSLSSRSRDHPSRHGITPGNPLQRALSQQQQANLLAAATAQLRASNAAAAAAGASAGSGGAGAGAVDDAEFQLLAAARRAAASRICAPPPQHTPQSSQSRSPRRGSGGSAHSLASSIADSHPHHGGGNGGGGNSSSSSGGQQQHMPRELSASLSDTDVRYAHSVHHTTVAQHASALLYPQLLQQQRAGGSQLQQHKSRDPTLSLGGSGGGGFQFSLPPSAQDQQQARRDYADLDSRAASNRSHAHARTDPNLSEGSSHSTSTDMALVNSSSSGSGANTSGGNDSDYHYRQRHQHHHHHQKGGSGSVNASGDERHSRSRKRGRVKTERSESIGSCDSYSSTGSTSSLPPTLAFDPFRFGGGGGGGAAGGGGGGGLATICDEPAQNGGGGASAHHPSGRHALSLDRDGNTSSSSSSSRPHTGGGGGGSHSHQRSASSISSASPGPAGLPSALPPSASPSSGGSVSHYRGGARSVSPVSNYPFGRGGFVDHQMRGSTDPLFPSSSASQSDSDPTLGDQPPRTRRRTSGELNEPFNTLNINNARFT